jgi:glycosyltransferase involved in cell wall biosynthesis
MRLKLFLEHRFKRTPDGQVWSSMFPYDTWTRYLSEFSEVILCARVSETARAGSDLAPATGERVSLAGLPYYHGPEQYFFSRKRLQATVAGLVTPGDAYVVRVPGILAKQAVTALNAAGVPYAIEAIADPWDMFSPGASNHPLRWLFRRLLTRSMREQCANAAVSLYVTEHALQRRYPPNAGREDSPTPKTRCSTYAVSDVCLANGAFVLEPRPIESFEARPLHLLCVGSFNLLYKAQDVLVKAFCRAVRQGLDAHLSFVGDGIYRPKIEALARKHSAVHGRVEFLGQLRAGAAVREMLDRSHLFVLPSRQEGLPRAALEAMARALPCIGSNVGGFPEILESDAIVPADDAGALASCMLRLAASPARLAEMSTRNLQRAADFHAEKLTVRQKAFYTAVRALFSNHWRRDLTSAAQSDLAANPDACARPQAA